MDKIMIYTEHSSIVRNERGSALLMVLTAMIVVTTLTVAMLTLTSTTLRGNARLQTRASALAVAESGAELGVLWLRDQSIPPTSDQTITNYLLAPPSGSSWVVTLTNDVHNTTQYLKTYIVTCTATVDGKSRQVKVVARQSTFGKYAYFTDRETSSSGSAIWWNSKDSIDGPVHSNNLSGKNFNIDYSGWSTNNPRRPIFQDIVTGCGSSISYQPSRPTTETTFQRVFLNGSKGYLLGVNKVNLPPSTTVQKEAAWGGTSGFPATTGVYIRSDANNGNGGTYIHGDCTIAMSVDGSGNQLMTVKQGANTTVVKYDLTAGTTTVLSGPVGSGSATSASSSSNGVVYCTGAITSLAGTIADNKVVNGQISRRSAWTICTDTNGLKDITITGNLVYQTRPDKTQDMDAAVNLAAGTLGLVAQDIRIADAGVASPNNHPDREIDAVMLAGSSTVDGSISVNNYNDNKGKGTLKVIGGLIQSTRGIVASLSSGVVQSGYAKDYRYDQRLSTAPPPFFPTTGAYSRLSWEVIY